MVEQNKCYKCGAYIDIYSETSRKLHESGLCVP